MNRKENRTAVTGQPQMGLRECVDKLLYVRSFAAKLALSEPVIKQCYAMLATELLSYEKVVERDNWSGSTFYAGQKQIAKFGINGATLVLTLAAAPEKMTGVWYRADNSADRRKNTAPAQLKIQSERSAKVAAHLIENMAKAHGLVKKRTPVEPVNAENFPAESFEKLLTRGWIRLLKPELDETPEEGDIYDDTSRSVGELLSRHGTYRDILELFSDGEASVRQSERLMLRAIDEVWVQTVEDCVTTLDHLIRHPVGYIAETEEVLPIELTRKITGRSIAHLGQHSDYIAKIDGDEITPNKLLNVFRDDSLLTYENKFLNTLLARLYLFVHRRYEIWKKNGMDEKVRAVEFENRFRDGEARGVVRMSIELSERYEGSEDVKNYTYESGLWNRVERLDDIVSAYMGSDFVKRMGKNYVHPPIMRTNAILKNKYFRQCLALWEFIESYDDGNYGLLVNEKLMDVSQEYQREIASELAPQYLFFRHYVCGEEAESDVLGTFESPVLHARVVEESEGVSEDEFSTRVKNPEDADEENILFAMAVALRADALLEDAGGEFAMTEPQKPVEEASPAPKVEVQPEASAEVPEETEELPTGELQPDPVAFERENVRNFYESLTREFSKYRGVEVRSDGQNLAYVAGETVLARAFVRENVLWMGFAIEPETADAGYRLHRLNSDEKYNDTPALMRIDSPRSLKYAKRLIASICAGYSLTYDRQRQPVIRNVDKAIKQVREKVPVPLYTGKMSSVSVTPAEVSAPVPRGAMPSMDVAADLAAGSQEVRIVHVPAEMPEAYEQKTEKSEMPQMKFPDSMDYSDPAVFGLDDPSGFIQDIEEHRERELLREQVGDVKDKGHENHEKEE